MTSDPVTFGKFAWRVCMSEKVYITHITFELRNIPHTILLLSFLAGWASKLKTGCNVLYDFKTCEAR